MTEISLVLPFALPPPELAVDLVRALQTPALASLLTRTASHRALPFDDALRATPHETWLARHLGVSATGAPDFARASMRGFGLNGTEGTWFIVHPAHIEIARSHLLMTDQRRLHLSDAHARALFDLARPYFDDSGKTLLYGDAQTWFLRADDWTGLDTATPDAATGLNLTDWMPKGPRAIAYRKLQNEIQMLWFEHAVNAEREAQGLAAINGFWPWGAQPSAPVNQSRTLAVLDAPRWLMALAGTPAPSPEQVFGSIAGTRVLVCDSLSQAAIGADWASWLAQMQRLEQSWLAPALQAIAQGRLGKLRLVLSHRNAHHEFITTKLAQRAFWRRPTLDRLLP